MRLARLLLFMIALASSSFAAVIYDFTYTGEFGDVSDFSFQITSTNYLSDSLELSFTPFDITAGSETFTMTQGTLASSTCFTFGSDGASVDGCSASPGVGSALVQFGFGMTNIHTPGTYVAEAIVVGLTSDSKDVNGFGSMTLTVSDGLDLEAPESATLALTGLGLAGIGLARRWCKPAASS